MSRPATRQQEIFTLLARHGVMDTNTLMQLFKAAPKSRSTIREALSALHAKGLIRCGTLKLGGSPSRYWHIANDKASIKRVLAITGLGLEQIRIKSCHWSQFPHENLCTLFEASIQRHCPSISVLREGSNGFKNLPEHLLCEQIIESGYMPDLCLGIPFIHGDSDQFYHLKKWIAVEIDRTMRSHLRLAQRMNIYTRHTAFNGLLYLMPEESSRRTLSKIYNHRKAATSPRIEGANQTFLASGCIQKSLCKPSSFTVHCNENETSLHNWLAMIGATEFHQRDELFLKFSDTRMGNLLKEEGP